MYFFLQQDTLKIMVTDLKVYVSHYTTPLPLTLMVCLGGLNPKTSFVLAWYTMNMSVSLSGVHRLYLSKY